MKLFYALIFLVALAPGFLIGMTGCIGPGGFEPESEAIYEQRQECYRDCGYVSGELTDKQAACLRTCLRGED